jgi:hypothetical protein
MSFRPIGKWIAVTSDIGGEKTSEAGIIYNDNSTGKGGMIWSLVRAVGPDVKEDIKIGDKVMWELATFRGNSYGSLDLIHESNVELVDRNETE